MNAFTLHGREGNTKSNKKKECKKKETQNKINVFDNSHNISNINDDNKNNYMKKIRIRKDWIRNQPRKLLKREKYGWKMTRKWSFSDKYNIIYGLNQHIYYGYIYMCIWEDKIPFVVVFLISCSEFSVGFAFEKRKMTAREKGNKERKIF